jgi:hypothetical protein
MGEGNIFETLYKMPTSLLYNKPKIFDLNELPKIDLNKVACMMPFRNSFDDVYTAIKGSCTELGLGCERVDEIYNNKAIIADVVKLIDEAGLIVCDLTGKNPNVLYETGIAHALGREVVILSQDIANDVPFDLKHLRCIEYSGTNQIGRDKLKGDLSKTIKSVLGM